MFSGKTTKLIELYNKFNTENKCLAINYALDTRYSNNQIISHDGLKIDAIYVTSLNEVTNIENNYKFIDAEYIFINEAQFFKNLKSWILNIVNTLGKKVVLCGLDYDFKREKFGELIDLLPFASRYYKLMGKCNNCLNPSIYSHRLINNNKQILIGNKEYIPLCEECYNKINNISLNNSHIAEY